jgi:hypothetical protein
MEIANLKGQIETLKVMIEIAHLRDTGITAILRQLIEANPSAVDVDGIEKLLNDEHGKTTALRDEGHRRADIHTFMIDVGLIRRV